MRIMLDRKHLLGFETATTGLETSVNAAKVGTKTVVVGVPSASHADLLRTERSRPTLTFPAKVR